MLNCSKCNPSSSLPSATTESRKTVSALLFSLSKQSSLFFSYHWCEDIFQPSKVGQNSMTELLQARTTSTTVRVSSQDCLSAIISWLLQVVWLAQCALNMRVSQGFWGTREHWQNMEGNKSLFFLGNRGVKFNKCKTNNLVRKFITRGTKLGNIGQFWRDNKDSPPGETLNYPEINCSLSGLEKICQEVLTSTKQFQSRSLTSFIKRERLWNVQKWKHMRRACKTKYEKIYYVLVAVETVAKCRLAAFYCTLRGILLGAS